MPPDGCLDRSMHGAAPHDVLLLLRYDGHWRVGGCQKGALRLLHDMALYDQPLSHPFGRLFDYDAVTTGATQGIVAVDFDTCWVGSRNRHLEVGMMDPAGSAQNCLPAQWSLAQELTGLPSHLWGAACASRAVRATLFQRALDAGALHQIQDEGQACGKGPFSPKGPGFVFQPPGWTVESFGWNAGGLAGLQAGLLARADSARDTQGARGRGRAWRGRLAP